MSDSSIRSNIRPLSKLTTEQIKGILPALKEAFPEPVVNGPADLANRDQFIWDVARHSVVSALRLELGQRSLNSSA